MPLHTDQTSSKRKEPVVEAHGQSGTSDTAGGPGPVGPPWRAVTVPPKGKHRLTTGLGNSTPRDATERNQSVCSKTRTRLFLPAKPWACPTSTSRWRGKQNAVNRTSDSIRQRTGENYCTEHAATDEPWTHRVMWNKSFPKPTCCVIPLMWSVQKRQLHTDRHPWWLPRAGAGGVGWDATIDKCGGSFSRCESALKLDYGDGCTTF